MIYMLPRVGHFDICTYFYQNFTYLGHLDSGEKMEKNWIFFFIFLPNKYIFWVDLRKNSLYLSKRGINRTKNWNRNPKIFPYFFDSKLSLDIKMGNLWQYKNHHFKWKYYLVLLQERSEIIQFKSGHPVWFWKYELSN